MTSAGKKHERARQKRAAGAPLREAYNYGRDARRAELEEQGFVELSGGTWKPIAKASGAKLWSSLRAESPPRFDDIGAKRNVWVPLWVLVVWNATRPRPLAKRLGYVPTPRVADLPDAELRRLAVEGTPNRDWRNLARRLVSDPEGVGAVEAAYRLGELDAAAQVLAELEEDTLKRARIRTSVSV